MLTGRMYTVVISGTVSPAAAFDFLSILPASSKPVRLRRIRIAQTSEPASEEEQIGITLYRGYSSAGSGGASPTPAQLCPGDSAAGFTVNVMNTTVGSGGAPVTLLEDAWNTRAGYDMAFAPE